MVRKTLFGNSTIGVKTGNRGNRSGLTLNTGRTAEDFLGKDWSKWGGFFLKTERLKH